MVTVIQTDAELVERCLEAKDAFEELYARHAPAVLAFLKGLHRGDEHAALDSLQETFLRAYRALPRFDRARPLRPWLFTIAANTAKDALERMKRVESRAPESLDAASGDESEKRVAASDAWATIVRAAGEKLSPRQLGAFLLARGQGFSYEEIAKVHGCSTATVKRDLRDALETLSGAAAKLGLVSS